MKLTSVLVALLVLTTGCASFQQDWKKSFSWWPTAQVKPSKYETPVQLIAIWTPDVLTQPDKPPTRGFGGRLYFYNDKQQAIPVEGQLIVYGYDDSSLPQDSTRPEKKFAFTAEQFTKHFSQSDLGASYSIWIPWDEVGGEQRKVSLVPVFTSSSGQIVMGQQAVNMLEGRVQTKPREPNPSLLANRSPLGVQQVIHEQPAVAPAAEEPRMKTTTINLPPSLKQRLANSPVVPVQTSPPAGFVPPTVTSPREGVPGAAIPAGAPQATVAEPTGVLPDEPKPGSRSAHFGQRRSPVPASPSGSFGRPAPWTPPYPAAQPSFPLPASTPPTFPIPAGAAGGH